MKTKIKTVLLLSLLLVICASCRKKDDNKPYNNSSTVTDIEGNVYHTVKIGTQVWMVENLKTTKYNDGTAIPLVSDNTAWTNLITPGYCWYNNDATTYKNTYGALYNWYAVNTAKLAPKGWHIASDAEWTTLENYLIANGYNYDGTTTGNKIAKALAATTNWTIDTYADAGTIGNDLTKNNSSGFSALPGGGRYGDRTFGNVGGGGIWWSSTESSTFYALISAVRAVFGIRSTEYVTNGAWIGWLNYADYHLNLDLDTKSYGFSVRCVRD